MKISYLILLIFNLTLISCSSKRDKLGNNPSIQSIFNEKEINDLEKILDFFENQISEIENRPIENLQNCYESFFIRLEKAEKTGFIEIKIPFGKQLNLYNEIDTSTFNQIWCFHRSWKCGSSDTLKSISINLNGKYVVFLESLGKEYSIIKRYDEMLRGCGDISGGMVASLLMLHKKYDTTDIRIRLFIAIHYLTLNDQFERNEKY